MTRVLVVGATGLLGRLVCDGARSAGHQIHALVREGSSGRRSLEAAGFMTVVGDLKDPATIRAACAGMDVVITTANSMLSRRAGDSLESVDRRGTLDLVAAAASAGVRRFIYISVAPQFTDAIPFIRYKREVERAVIASGMQWFVLQPTAFTEIHAGPVGGWDFSRGRARVTGSGRTPIGYISVRDVAAFAVAAIDHEPANRMLPLAGPEPLSAHDALEIAGRLRGTAFKVQRVPLSVLTFASRSVGWFNPILASLLMMIVEQERASGSPPVSPYEEFGVRPTAFAEYVERQLNART